MYERHKMIYTLTLNPALDKTLTVPSFAPGKVNRVLETRKDPGGKGINVSKALKELGSENVAMGILGGSAGEYILGALAQMGIESDFVVSKRPTRTNIKLFDPVTRLTTDINEAGGIDPEDALVLKRRLLKVLKAGDLCVISGRLDGLGVDEGEWIRDINALGAKVFLDTQGAALKSGVESSAYMIKPNAEEMAEMTGLPVNTFDEAAARAKEVLAASSVRAVLVSMGEAGAVYADRECVLYGESPEIRAASSVGAGDSMLAGFVHGVCEGLSPEERFKLSIACGAAAAQTQGSACPEKQQIYSLLGQVKLGRIL
jgi:1-phosphofructokinase